MNEEITTDRTDEIGLMANAFDRMRVSLNKIMRMLAEPQGLTIG